MNVRYPDACRDLAASSASAFAFAATALFAARRSLPLSSLVYMAVGDGHTYKAMRIQLSQELSVDDEMIGERGLVVVVAAHGDIIT